jgi:hypothetical protein
MADLRIGTSAFTANGWPGTFYPEGLPEREPAVPLTGYSYRHMSTWGQWEISYSPILVSSLGRLGRHTLACLT